MPRIPDKLPELMLARPDNPSAARQISRLAAAGRLRKLYAGVYTSNLDSPADRIVLRHWREIVGHLLPGGVISHRSAFDSRPHDGMLVVTRGQNRRDLKLPGLTVHVLPGAPPRTELPAYDAPVGSLFISSDPRRFLENLSRGRGWAERVLLQAELEKALDGILMVGGEHRLNQLRDQARDLAEAFGFQAQFKRLDGLIGGLLGTQDARKLTALQALARAAGRPYDPMRLELFDALFAQLNRSSLAQIADPAPSGSARENFAFFEAYFSNYIEGTTFTIEEAESIVFHGQIIENRSADSHDMLGTFKAAVAAPWRDQPPQSADAFLSWLRSVNALVMERRADKKPGEWKDKPNQAGNTYFVAPELVPGTLREGFSRIQALTDPLARAIMTMFVAVEVHPFLDGNGRTARLAMNCVLSAEGLSRIIIPTVYRDDYLLPLKALSHHHDGSALIASLGRAQRWTTAFEYGAERGRLRDGLARCNAFQEDLSNYRLVFPDKS